MTLSYAAIDDDDPRPWEERIITALGLLSADLTESVIQAGVDELNRMILAEDNSTARVRRDSFIRFLERSVGTGTYEHLRQALVHDVAIVATALHRAADTLLPYAVALDDMMRLLPPNKRALTLPSDPARSVLVLAVVLDRHLLALADAATDDRVTPGLFAQVLAPSADEVADAIPRLRKVISGRSRALAEQLGSMVSRKIQGARDALATSADSVSQASNSLIELIDRTLRTAFTDEEVLAWLEQNYPGDAKLTYQTDKGDTKPTKRGQVCCFLNLGQPKLEDSTFTELLADVLITARGQLQTLKHEDTGDPEEINTLAELMAAVEGFFALGIGLHWAVAPADALEKVHHRLNPAKRTASALATVSA